MPTPRLLGPEDSLPVREQPRRKKALIPSATVATAFLAAIAIGWGLLLLPISRTAQGRDTGLVDTLFTATSAVTVTGLSTVDTATVWSGFGKAVILLLIQIGGLGMATSGTLILLLVSRRLRLTTRLVAQAETPGLGLGDVRRVLLFVVTFTAIVEVALSLVLALVFWTRYDADLGQSLWLGLFHTVSAYNNAGFALFSDGLMGFSSDPFVLIPLMVAIVVGGVGFPVYIDMRHNGWRRQHWSIHTRLTLIMTAILLVFGTVFILWFESRNPATLAGRPFGEQLLNGVFGSVTPRTAGFNTIDYGAATEETRLITMVLMIIGGGSASTAGGIKVTTIVVLLLVVLSEARGDRDVFTLDRRLSEKTIRSAISVAVSYFFLVGIGLIVLISLSDIPLDDVLFETVSAIATVGLSTGVTGQFGTSSLFVLMFLMFTGRLGAMTLASAFALRRKQYQAFRYPEGKPIIG